MSRFRNRNIRNKFFVPSTAPKNREVNGTADSGIDVKHGYGEYVNRQPSGYPRGLQRKISSSSSSEGSEIGIIEEGLDTKDSSASSLSWGEDYELQATQLVKEEYERMERVLQCLEPIPPHYDRDEFKLWIKTFPCLSLTGPSSSLSAKARRPNIHSPVTEQEHFGTSKKDCDKVTLSVSKNPRNLTVINKLLGEPNPAQTHQPNPTSTTVYSNELAINNTINPRTLDIAFGSFLQIAPVAFPKKSSGDERRHNTNQKLPTMHYDTLPKYQMSRRKYTTPTSKTNSDFIVLPPIDLNLANNRSISASSSRLHQRKVNSEIFIKQLPDMSEMDHISYPEPKRMQKRKNRFVKLLQD